MLPGRRSPPMMDEGDLDEDPIPGGGDLPRMSRLSECGDEVEECFKRSSMAERDDFSSRRSGRINACSPCCPAAAAAAAAAMAAAENRTR